MANIIKNANSFTRKNIFWSIKVKNGNDVTTYKNIPYGKDSTFINNIVHSLKKDDSFQYTIRGYNISTINGINEHRNTLYESYTISSISKDDDIKQDLFNINSKILTNQNNKNIHYYVVSINLDQKQINKTIATELNKIDKSNVRTSTLELSEAI